MINVDGAIITNTENILRCGAFYLEDRGVKFALADINAKNPQIEELFYYAESLISFKDEILYPQNELSEKTISQGIQAILAHQKNLLINFNLDKPIKLFGVATSIFAETKNGQKFLDYIYKNTGIKFEIAQTAEQRNIRYDAAIAALGNKKSHRIILWDSSKDKNSHFITKHQDQYISGYIFPKYNDFYLTLRQKFNKKYDLNPITNKEFDKALDIALEQIETPDFCKNYINNRNIIVGSGPMHNHLAQHYVNFEKIKNTTREMSDVDLWEYNQVNLRDAIEFLLNKTNKQLTNFMYNKDGFLSVDKEVSNLILTYAVMLKLNIEKVQSLDCKEIFGVLLKK
jgi:exopolyphosphatase/pppGpp-phosphohydrolase